MKKSNALNSLSIFWKSIEAIGGGAREVALRKHLGPNYESIRPYLMPCPRLAECVACERTLVGHTYICRIMNEPEADGTFAAVCDNRTCPVRYLRREELVRYTINPKLLGPAIARCLGLHPQLAEVVPGVWQIGQLPGTNQAVIFARCKSCEALEEAVEKLVLHLMEAFVLITPTRRCHNCCIAQLLRRIDGAAFALDESTILDGVAPVLSEAGQLRWRTLQETVAGSAPGEMIFPTPPGARWHDLSLRFRDGHSLVASLGAIARRYTFQDMGMMDNRRLLPDAQWELLRHFATEMGMFTWASRQANSRNKKRKERLAQRLKGFFGLPEEPFAYRKDDGGWEAVFNIQCE